MAMFTREATVEWSGDVLRGAGAVSAGSEAFTVAVTFPRLRGEPSDTTTPEELLAASHATCFGIGLRSVIAQRGGTATRVRATATITAEKGAAGIRVRTSHLRAAVEGLEGIERSMLPEIARAAEEGCTISAAIRGTVTVSVEVAEVTNSGSGSTAGLIDVQGSDGAT